MIHSTNHSIWNYTTDLTASCVKKDLSALHTLGISHSRTASCVSATESIPIPLSLILKGLSPGTAFVLLMARPAANFASFTLISREMGKRAAIVYLGSIIVGAMAMGLAIDYLLAAHWFAIGHDQAMHGACHHEFSTFSTICFAILAGLLIYSLIRRFYNPKTNNHTDMTQEYIITGMNCPH